jgi:hypothetical protein
MWGRLLTFSGVLILSATTGWAGDSSVCDAARLCPGMRSCANGKSVVADKYARDFNGKTYWHSDVIREEYPERPNSFRFCYFRAMRIYEPTETPVPVFWQPAGMKYFGSQALKSDSCLVACTESDWVESGPTKPIAGRIEFGSQNPAMRDAPAWGPKEGWASFETPEPQPVPVSEPEPPASRTIISHDADGVRLQLRFASQQVSSTKVRYVIENLGPTPVRIFWNIRKSEAMRKLEGPFRRPGLLLTNNKEPYSMEVDTGGGTRKNRTQVVVEVEGKAVLIFSVPALGPPDGRYDVDPREIWASAQR